MTLWLIDENRNHHCLNDSFVPVFYVAGNAERLARFRNIAEKQQAIRTRLTERMDLWLNAPLEVLEISVLRADEFSRWTHWVHQVDSQLVLYNSNLMTASLYCWEKRLFPLAYVEVEVGDDGKIVAMECHDDEWDLNYKLPPFTFMHMRLAGASAADPVFGRRKTLEVKVEDRCWEFDDSDEPPAIGFARLLKRIDPDVILSELGDSIILPLLRQQAARLKFRLPLNRDRTVEVQQSKPRSFLSYGRMLFKATATTLFGRIHVDKHNSFVSEKCDCAGLWELARITKLPIQYAARTTPGSGISYMQMELAYRDGVLIPEQKAEPEEPKRPDQILTADRGGLIFTPTLGFTANVAELDFVSEYPSIMAHFNISPETVNCNCCPDASPIPELGYKICEKRKGITSRVVKNLIKKRSELKQRQKTANPEMAEHFKSQRDSLKWLLVCCFGYTGYKNARFGKIEAHEAINAWSRETLLVAKEMAEDRGFRLIHALVDSLYVCKDDATREDYEKLAKEIEKQTRLPLSIESVYRFVVFLPSKESENIPVPNRFFAVGENGELKIRGLECRRHDTPALVARMQREVLDVLAEARDRDDYFNKLETARKIFNRYKEQLMDADVGIEDLVVSKRMTREPRAYRKASLTAIAAQQLFGSGVKLRPGQTVEYVITDSRSKIPNERVRAYALWEGWHSYDRQKYNSMLREAFLIFQLKDSASAMFLWSSPGALSFHGLQHRKETKPEIHSTEKMAALEISLSK
jgi:DNA polymerase elongation subunit (family B)